MDTSQAPQHTPRTAASHGSLAVRSLDLLDLDEKFREGPRYNEFVQSQKRMTEDFRAIAKAGGGVYAEVTFKIDADGKSSVEGRVGAAAAGMKMVEHILVLSFGQRYEREMQEFVRIYYEYKGARWFK